MNTILRIAGPEDGGSSPPAPPTPKPTIASLMAENEQLKATIATQIATIANLTAAKAEADADEKLVLAKMQIGLTRDQAVAVVKRQKEFDASPLARKHRDYNLKAAARKAAAEAALDDK